MDPQTFPDDKGRLVTFAFTGDVVQYRVTEIEVPPPPKGLVLVQSSSEDSEAEAVIGRIEDTRTCTITNEYRIAPPTS